MRDRQHGCCFLLVTVKCLLPISELDGTKLRVYKLSKTISKTETQNQSQRDSFWYRIHATHPLSSVQKDGVIWKSIFFERVGHNFGPYDNNFRRCYSKDVSMWFGMPDFLMRAHRRGSNIQHHLSLCVDTERDRWVEGITRHFIIVPTGNCDP